jgi:uncharacterized membrane protein YgcG
VTRAKTTKSEYIDLTTNILRHGAPALTRRRSRTVTLLQTDIAMTDPSRQRTRKPEFARRKPGPPDVTDDAARKRSTAIKVGGIGFGLLALYSLSGPRKCPPEPQPLDPDYAQRKQEYDQCRQRRRSSSSSSGSSRSWGSSGRSISSTPSRGGFGSFGGGGG